MDRYIPCRDCGGLPPLGPMDPAPAGTYACECGDRYDAWKAERDAEEGEQQMEKEAPMIVRGSATPDTLHTQIEAAYDAAEKAAEHDAQLVDRIEAECDPAQDAANDAARAAMLPVDASYEAYLADRGPAPTSSPAPTALEPQGSLRRRVHVSISTKGQRTWDTTVEGTGYSEDEILAASDSLVREMEARYPAAGE